MPEHKESSDDGYISLPAYHKEEYLDRRSTERKVITPSHGSAFVAVRNTKYDQQPNLSSGLQR